MSDNNLFEIVFQEWKASLKERDKSAHYVQSNFEDLFEELKAAGASLEQAYAFVNIAVKAHQPDIGLVRTIFKRFKTSPNFRKFKTEKEFSDYWLGEIADKGNMAFFSVYPRQTIETLEEKEPKIYGAMTAREYKSQRKYADEFPRLNTEELEKKMLQGTYNPVEDLLSKKDEDGNSN